MDTFTQNLDALWLFTRHYAALGLACLAVVVLVGNVLRFWWTERLTARRWR